MDVSVIIPVYNGEQTIGRAIASVLGQTMPPRELIIVDDGSTDQTKSVIGSIESVQVPIRYVYQENARQAAARNHGARVAGGEWLAFLDADDVWLPEKLALQAKVVQEEPELHAVIGNYLIRDGQREFRCIPDVIALDRTTPAGLLEANFFWLPAVVLKKSAYKALGGIDEEFRNAEDVDLGFRFCKQYQYRVIPDVVAIYQRRPFSSSQQEAHDILGLLKFYDRVLARDDLTAVERRLAGEKRRFWRARQKLFFVRRTAVLEGQLAGIRTFFQEVWPRFLSLRALALLALLCLPGSVPYLVRTRWKNLDFTA